MNPKCISSNEAITLSVIIICHNQKDVLKRCIDSVLQQKTSFSTEIIVSDDNSTDGTREMLLNDYRDVVISTFCNSDDCSPSFTLERSGYNRLNGLKLARGKYLIHTDGDDFFTSTDLFQEMVDTLEDHPECNLCCQNYCVVDSENVDVPHDPKNKHHLLFQNHIIPVQMFFGNVSTIVNACYCMRRGDNFNAHNLWGGTYDDKYITARYIGNGDIAILNRCDFVYVQYGHSSCATMNTKDKDVIFHVAIGIAELAPSIAGAMLKKYTGSFLRVAKQMVLKRKISDEVQKYCSRFEGFLFGNLTNKFNMINWMRYAAICLVCLFMIIFHLRIKPLRRLLYRLAIGPIADNVVF